MLFAAERPAHAQLDRVNNQYSRTSRCQQPHNIHKRLLTILNMYM